MPVKRALISVSDKTGIVEFASGLAKLKVEILSSGGTAKVLHDAGVPVIEVSKVTRFPEMMDGRVKTLHPKIHGGILADRSKKTHVSQAKKNKIPLIDLVIVNLYPFKKTIEKKGVSIEEAIENIDIGGPTLVRSAAKNHKHVAVVVDPNDYPKILKELESSKEIKRKTKELLAVKAFRHTAAYDVLIQDYLEKRIGEKKLFPDDLLQSFEKAQDLKYGENPFQQAAFYRDSQIPEPCVSNAVQLHGKQLGYNNILDLNDALELVKDFKDPTAAVIKHTNPCGVASAKTIDAAYKKAHKADPLAAFGCVIALNRTCNLKAAEVMKDFFIEAIIAPGYTKDAFDLLKIKLNRRILETGPLKKTNIGLETKKVVGGLLAQTRKFPEVSAKNIKVVSKRKPTKAEIESLLFAWKVCKHVKSNSIVYAKDHASVAVGAGQMSRVDAVKICNFKSGKKAKGCAMASDAFFPFRDGVDEAAKAGVTAVIQPGGSIRDEEVLKAVNQHKMAMVYTGHRIFKH
ncbi:MAG: bifunctional phosphoribosylaminoimidazolecarboxamide formyltransferase/IMP cyclohydrolase [Candidatus Altiarchaeota archaeon]